jgi:hypothetical protein
MHISKKFLAGAVVALALITASAAYAAIPDAGGVIHGCYNKTSGQLRVTDTATNTPSACTNKENALNWNQQGPSAAGAGAPSVVFKKDWTYGSFSLPTDSAIVVQKITIPSQPAEGPGPVVVYPYLVTARAKVHSSVAQAVSCWLYVGNQEIDYVSVNLSSDDSSQLSLIGTGSFFSTAELRCRGDVSGAGIGGVAMTAMPANIMPG